jgi:hypothetical protein
MLDENYWISILVSILMVVWIGYTILAMVYLNALTRKYLNPIPKDDIVGDKELKGYDELIQQFNDSDAINILVLSGGGVRGVIPLHVLTYIELATGKKIGELFDFFAGSSTGAISAGAFAVADSNGNYKFSAQQILDDYEANAKNIFSAPWYHQLFTLFGLLAPRFVPDGKVKVLDGYFGNLTLGELKGNLLVPVYNLESQKLEIIKSWQSGSGVASHANYLVKDVINGASSPPVMFPPLAFSLAHKNHMFIDPAVLINNPILHVLLYVRTLFPTKTINLVLVGNGGTATVNYDYKSLFSFGLYGLFQYLFNAPALSSKLYIEFIEQYVQSIQRMDNKVNFFRVNSKPINDMNPADVSEDNYAQLKTFAQQMLHENHDVIDKIIAAVKR